MELDKRDRALELAVKTFCGGTTDDELIARAERFAQFLASPQGSGLERRPFSVGLEASPHIASQPTLEGNHCDQVMRS